MTWQEELRKLDEDFSSGSITADEYRVRRDQVLSSAVAPPGEDTGGASAEATQIVSPAQPGEADSTQVVSGAGQQDNPDATQVVRNAPSEPMPRYSQDADRTQAVPHWETQQPAPPPYQPSPPYGVQQPHSGGFPQQPPVSPPGGFPQQPGYPPQPPPWHAAQTPDEAAPLWGGDEFPPIAPPTEPDWVTQGPEFGKETEEKGRVGKIIGVVLAVVLLAGIAFAAWMLWGRDAGEPTAGPGEKTTEQPVPSTATSAPPTSPTDAPDPLPIAELPGRAEEHPEVSDFADMKDKNYFTDKELAAYRKSGAGATKFHVQHMDEGGNVTIVLASTDSAKKGETAVKSLRKIQLENNAKAVKDAPDNVAVTEISTDNGSEVRAHYLSGNVIVRIELRSEEKLSDARTVFEEVLNAQLEELPADGG